MRTNWKYKSSMSNEQLRNVPKWLEKDLEHFSQDDELIQKQIQKKYWGNYTFYFSQGSELEVL